MKLSPLISINAIFKFSTETRKPSTTSTEKREGELKPPFATSGTLQEQMQLKTIHIDLIISFIGKSKEKIPLEIVNLQTINNII